MLLPDNETKTDLLNNEAIAGTIINLLVERPDQPVTIGVHGDWGAGKSSVLEMVEDGLSGKEKVLCIKFNGWRFQGFEDAKIALVEGIVTELIDSRPGVTKVKDAAIDLLKRVDYLKLAKRGGGLAWNAATGLPSPDQIGTALGGLKNLVTNPGDNVSKEDVETAVKQFDGILKPSEKRVPKEIEEFRKDFSKLLDAAEVDQLVVLIDDLDRCLPDTAIETLEAIRLLLFTERTAFVIGADEAMIEYSVRKHFPDLPDSVGPYDYARNYLEKLIQIPFRIPALGETETRIYVTLLLVGSILGEDDPEFLSLIAEGRERLKRPWASTPLDAGTVKGILGAKFDQVQDVLLLSDHVGPMLARGTQGNPRQIKRFLNALLLRKSIADARGFGSDVQLSVLGKLMLAERFLPGVFGYMASVAAADANGHCEAVSKIEKGEVKPDDKEIPEWFSSPLIENWASLEPKLGELDLRPYLFVSKDKTDFFGSNSALGALAGVVKRLLGPTIRVRGMVNELKLLPPADAVEIFEAIRLHILSQGSLAKKPEGYDGLIALVGAQPVLEPRLIDFLESLPSETVGSWAVFNPPLVDEAAKQRLHALLEKWSEQKDNKSLRATSAAALKLGK